MAQLTNSSTETAHAMTADRVARRRKTSVPPVATNSTQTKSPDSRNRFMPGWLYSDPQIVSLPPEFTATQKRLGNRVPNVIRLTNKTNGAASESHRLRAQPERKRFPIISGLLA